MTDPDEALARAREAARHLREKGDPAYVVELLEHFEALDAWLVAGGSLPKGWRR